MVSGEVSRSIKQYMERKGQIDELCYAMCRTDAVSESLSKMYLSDLKAMLVPIYSILREVMEEAVQTQEEDAARKLCEIAVDIKQFLRGKEIMLDVAEYDS